MGKDLHSILLAISREGKEQPASAAEKVVNGTYLHERRRSGH